MTQRTRITELGQERCCSKCGEWWPDDTEFFFRTRGRTCSPCKACYYELPSVVAKEQRRKEQRQAAREAHL